jgi:hypothetical protein
VPRQQFLGSIRHVFARVPRSRFWLSSNMAISKDRVQGALSSVCVDNQSRAETIRMLTTRASNSTSDGSFPVLPSNLSHCLMADVSFPRFPVNPSSCSTSDGSFLGLLVNPAHCHMIDVSFTGPLVNPSSCSTSDGSFLGLPVNPSHCLMADASFL